VFDSLGILNLKYKTTSRRKLPEAGAILSFSMYQWGRQQDGTRHKVTNLRKQDWPPAPQGIFSSYCRIFAVSVMLFSI